MIRFLRPRFYRSLPARNVTDEDARRLTAEMTWRVYEKMAAVPWLIARLTKASPYERLEGATQVFRHFPFRAPSYDMVDVDAAADVVAFDVRRCTVTFAGVSKRGGERRPCSPT